jgi:mRNA interferase MazF
MSASEPSRGEIWSITRFHRPALVVSVDKFNHGPAGLVVVLPITSKDKDQPIHVPVKPPEGGLSMLSFIKCDDIRSVSKQRLKQFRGTVSAQRWPRSKCVSESFSTYETRGEGEIIAAGSYQALRRTHESAAKARPEEPGAVLPGIAAGWRQAGFGTGQRRRVREEPT